MLSACGRWGFESPTDDASTGAIRYRDVVVADGPIAYYRLGDAAGSANAKEEIASAQGMYSGACSLGQVGAIASDPDTQVVFDGTTCKVVLPDAFNFAGTAGFTLEMWASLSFVPTSVRHLFTKQIRDASNPIDGYAVIYTPAVGIQLERVVSSANVKTGGPLLIAGRKVHVVVGYDGTTMTLYIDGQVARTQTDARMANAISTPALIGAQPNGGYWPGTLDEVAIYDKPLPAARVALHYQIGAGL